MQGGWVGLATALSPATAGHFKFLLHYFFVGLGLNLPTLEAATLYSYEQGLTERKFAVSELFAPETLDLFSDG